VRIPQRLDSERTGRIGVDAYRCTERYDYVWVALGEPLTGIPELPEASDPGFRRIDQFYEEWRIGALRLMENSFDNAHIAFVHRATFGNIDNPTPVRAGIEEFEYGFNVRAEYPVKTRGVQARNLHAEGANQDTVRRNNSTWFMPFSRRLGITYPNGLRHTIFTAATPMTDDRAMIVQFCYRNDTEAQARAEDVIAFDRAVTLEDKAILEGTEPDVPLSWDPDRVEYNMMTDRPGVRMRRMLRALLEAHGEAEWRADGSAAPVSAAERMSAAE
jgi:phenylpropionate dioxygenase-like ring-hydroxylating dioxygenase large terminal subunit